MNLLRSQQFAIGIGITTAALLLSLLFGNAFDGLERAALEVQYRFRGESKIDSSIVVVYFGDGDIHALGGWPLKRSYYALLVSVLNDLGANVIGIDIAFPEMNTVYPEYDEVFSRVVRNAGNVVLNGYFKFLDAAEVTTADVSLLRFTYPQTETHFPVGKQFIPPFPEFADAAQGIGHASLTGDFRVPLFIRSGDRLFASFAFELLRLSAGAEIPSVRFSESAVFITDSKRPFTIPFDDDGTFPLSYRGGLSSLNTVNALQLIQAYDARRLGRVSTFPLESIRGKVIIVGIIAEGRSAFVPTPYARQFPAVGIHATALSNMVQKNYLTRIAKSFEYGIAFLLGILATAFTHAPKERLGVFRILGVLVFYSSCVFLLFVLFVVTIPIVRPIFTLLAVTIGLVFIKHQMVHSSFTRIEREKEQIAGQLRDKETRLAMLEREMFESEGGQDKGAELVEEIRRYKQEIRRLTAQVSDLQVYEPQRVANADTSLAFEGIIYRSGGSMESIVEFIMKIAQSDETVLLLGESGTGKELVAHAIHRQSHRREKPFLAVNCGALSETLLESELFGHERGAFTGAVKEKPGRFELADGGTIFLDEIGETSEAFQVKLLRVLQEGEFERVGGTQTMKAEVRVIAATNRDLKKAVGEKNFREDLYYRLNIFTIQLPSLRDRIDDIPVLIEHFIRAEHSGMQLSTNVMQALCQHEWRGNVRELQSVVKRAVVLARSDRREIIRMKDLPEEILAAAERVSDIEEQILASMREKSFSRNAVSETADELGGLNRGTVAEYFRGFCFKIFYEQQYNIEHAARRIAQNSDPDVLEKVRKKISEYLSNAVELIRKGESFEDLQERSRPKFKNLPQRYHRYLDEILRSYHQGIWNLDEK